jgi:signal transduction histidine kinase/CheY-like chemotaxis protein
MRWDDLRASLPYSASIGVGWVLYETIKILLWPHMTMWVSHLVSAVVVTLLATAVRMRYQRTVRLQVAHARQRQAAAEQASRAKNAFLARMSHELRTPLTVILGFAEVIEMGPDGSARGRAARIREAGQHLLSLITEILDLSRIETGQMALSAGAVSVQAMASECRDLLEPLAAAADVSITLGDGVTPTCYLRADQQRLKQVLLNLVGNAIKYNRRGGRVVLSCLPRPGNLLRLCVADTGAGIPPEKLARLFTPFERLGAEQSGVEGTGLGLALSRGLVQLMGGTLGVETEVGSGSTFWVELPPAPPPPPPPAPPAASPAPQPTDARSAARTVVLIEDSHANVALIEALLEQRPAVRLRTAYRGEVGLELARTHRPDLIVLDVHLPDLDGPAVLRHLKDDPTTRAIPVVALSADATPEQAARMRAAGAHSYLLKPLDVHYLLHILDTILA